MLYGLIGKKLLHSFSEKLFNEKFKGQFIYKLFEIDDVEEIKSLLMKEKHLKGFNVTIPYKVSIIPYLDKLDVVSSEIGAVNTVVVDNNKLYGYNTDAIGFENAYKHKLNLKHNIAIILGTGGSSRAIAYVLNKYKIKYLKVSRNKKEKNVISYLELPNYVQECTLIINTTPIGMFPAIDDIPPINEKTFINKPIVIDIIYNPQKTKLLKMAESYGCEIFNGFEMLKQQAIESWKIWGLVK
jgi:shikimate dehydrogenase